LKVSPRLTIYFLQLSRSKDIFIPSHTHTHTHTIFSAFSHAMPRKTQSPSRASKESIWRALARLCVSSSCLLHHAVAAPFYVIVYSLVVFGAFTVLLGFPLHSPRLEVIFLSTVLSGLSRRSSGFVSLSSVSPSRQSFSALYLFLSLVPFRSTFPVFLSALLYPPHLYFRYKCAPKVISTEFGSRV